MTILTFDVAIDMILLCFLCITAVGIIYIKNLLVGAVLLSIFSLLMAALYLALSAPDVAITEAAVGAGFSTILFLLALSLTGFEEKKHNGSFWLPLITVLLCAGGLIYATLGMPNFGSADTPIHTYLAPHYIDESGKEIGIPNIVTSVLASYRGYDTLGETVVIFTAAISILALLSQRLTKRGADSQPHDKV